MNDLASDPSYVSLCTEVARSVMSWEIATIPWAYHDTALLWHTADGDPIMTEFSWQPDRNDAQNMQVLDRMLDLGFEFTLTTYHNHAVASFSRGSEQVARSVNPDRRIALLRAAVAARKRITGS